MQLQWRTQHRIPLILLVFGLQSVAMAAGCSSSERVGVTDPDLKGPDASAPNGPNGDSGDPGDGGSDTLVEQALTVELVLSIATSDAGPPATTSTGPMSTAVSDAGSVDGGETDAGTVIRTARLTITARDGTTPVVTDLWLYTLDGAPMGTPLTAFTSTAARKSPRLMLPATLGGKASGLAPADDGVANGLMTNTTRGTTSQGAFVSTVNGTVVVTLAAVPTSPILVVAAVEDQRYAGAAAINPDGTPAAVPAGVGVPESHPRVSFERDVMPILKNQCSLCHNPLGPENANFYLVTGTRDEIVNDNFTIAEGTLRCQTSYPDGGDAFNECVQAIASAEFLVEPGAPAVSDILQRARPDENMGTSDAGLLWYGSKGSRYNATYGDRRMPSTTYSLDAGDWNNVPTAFDMAPDQYQVIWNWVAQGALP
jgi:hypothetical protein